MIYSLSKVEDKWLEDVYAKAINDLGSFFKINWTINPPKIYLVSDRASIDDLWGKETPRWLDGWTNSNNVYLLSYKNFDKESENKFDKERYEGKLRHELTHLYFGVASGRYQKPLWLVEGLAQYIAGDQNWRTAPENFSVVFDSFEKHDKEIYSEAVFLVKALLDNFGKDKMMDMINRIKLEKPDEDKYKMIFKEVYDFDFEPDAVNSFWHQIKK